MNKTLATSIAVCLLLANSGSAIADSIKVNVPVNIKAMRDEVKYAEVECNIYYISQDGRSSYSPLGAGRSGFLELDMFGNLKRELSLKIDTSGISPEQVHDPRSKIFCVVALFDSEKTPLLSHVESRDSVVRENFIDEENSNFRVESDVTPDEAPPQLQRLSGNNGSEELQLNRPNNLRIR